MLFRSNRFSTRISLHRVCDRQVLYGSLKDSKMAAKAQFRIHVETLSGNTVSMVGGAGPGALLRHVPGMKS